MHRIPVTAPQRHGKSTFAELAQEIEPSTFHIETSDVIIDVANAFHAQMPIPPKENNAEWMNSWLIALPDILEETVQTNTTYDQLHFTAEDVEKDLRLYEKFFVHSMNLTKNPELAIQKITPENKAEYRPILQWLGGYLVSKVTETIWYDEIYRRLDKAEQQGAALAVIGGLRYLSDEKSVRTHGDPVMEIFRPGVPILDQLDPTERERSKITPDFKLINNGSLEDFRSISKVIIADVMHGEPKSLYIATEVT